MAEWTLWWVGRELEKLNYYWYEEPLVNTDIEDYIQLSRTLDIPIVTTETLYYASPQHFVPFLKEPVADIMRTDAERGITPGKKVASDRQQEIRKRGRIQMADKKKHSEKTINPSRRELASVVPSGAPGTVASGSVRSSSFLTNNSSPNTPVLAMYPGLAEPGDEYLLFIRQIGLDTVMVMGLPEHLRSVEGLLSIKKRYADAGINVYTICGPISMQPKEIVLNMPGRDKLIEDYLNWIRTLGRAGIHYTNSGFMGGTGVWTTGRGNGASTRGAATREFDDAASTVAAVSTPSFEVNRLAFGREYTREEILENFTYFVRRVVPVAEEAGVCIGFHPDDPPGYQSMAGVARIFSSFQSIKEVLQIAGSPNIGIILCGGIWLEGGERMGADLAEAIRWFVTNKKTWEFHFRNVSSPLPRFLETFPDNGYYDMYEAMKALVDVGYSGIVHLDHTPAMVGAPYSYPAYTAGYMKACLQRALAEAEEA